MEQKTFIIADTHFGHKNVIEFENRPFSNTDEMDKYMIAKWNEVVSENDVIFHLGDVFIGSAKYANEILPQLNGRKILILGNHDHYTMTKWRKLGFDPYRRYIYKDYLLTHMPVDETPLKVAVEYGLLKGNIHGHVHLNNQYLNPNLYICSCVELIHYQPILFEELIKE